MIKRLLRTIKSSITARLVPRIVRAVRSDSLTFLEEAALCDLFKEVKRYEHERREGILIEAGCAAGGSALVIATAKSGARSFYVYDVFGMIPPPCEKDDRDVHERYEAICQGRAVGIDGRPYYGYEQDLLEKVQARFQDHGIPTKENNVHLIKGLFQETLRIDQPVLMAHLDGDWYQSIMVCLERIEPLLIPGGRFVIDDYSAWSGCRKAVDEYFGDKHKQFEFVQKSRLHIIRI